jgi:putative ABC transport system permease protein
MEQMTNIASALSRILTGVALLSMLIGGVVIMCLTTVSVAQRKPEIGLRRAVGASRGDILVQFLLEALIVSAMGGILGAGIGLGGANAVAIYQKLPVIFSGSVLAEALAMAVGVGLLFGIYPAWQASRLDPVAALRA